MSITFYNASILAQAAPQQSFGDALFSMIPLLVMIFGIYYFILARPMRKEQEEHKNMVNSLIVGDKVVTIGGLVGDVHSIAETDLVLKTGQKSSVTILKTSIRRKVKEGKDV